MQQAKPQLGSLHDNATKVGRNDPLIPCRVQGIAGLKIEILIIETRRIANVLRVFPKCLGVVPDRIPAGSRSSVHRGILATSLLGIYRQSATPGGSEVRFQISTGAREYATWRSEHGTRKRRPVWPPFSSAFAPAHWHMWRT